ncbi:FAD/NAD(P)-binding protein [Gulosibacter molinativorax]|uniref:Adenylate cyclase n=1 Tax=Gulosibacter molinativorax TaxID=256821 RepID=A0ABT7C5J1_9MICO|nr:FAD/NAD(P)-binding protein [Gulosibacter molinativorax]MDJ1370419.1 adenylate cyclase [Gulosibacter molinativorax]QUY61332.1 Adenylate cyclase [Gulosibacter molinativorax]
MTGPTRRAARLVDHDGHLATRCITFVGAGPRTAGIVERLIASQPEIDDRPLILHLIDPYPPGAGRIWRDNQSGLLTLNSMAGDVTMFTDESCSIEGPVVTGPDLATWAKEVREGRIRNIDIDPVSDPQLAEELEHLTPTSFPTRRLHERYMTWFLEQAVDGLSPGSKVMWHRDEVIKVSDDPSGAQVVTLASGDELTTDLVIYSFGHLGSEVTGEARYFSDFAALKGSQYLPPSYTADVDLGGFEAGSEIIVRGLGLVAIDLIVLLTLGRGGKFVREKDGKLRYLASGHEPKLLLGSRRGVPYRSKVSSTPRGERYVPRYFDGEVAKRIAEKTPGLDFSDHLYPLIRREVLHAYYLELFTGSPDRVAMEWLEFRDGLDRLDLDGDAYTDLVARAIPDPEDRLDLAVLDRPLAGVHLESSEALQEWSRDYIAHNLERSTDPRYSEMQALFNGVLFAFMASAEIATSPNWDPTSFIREYQRRWFKFFSYIASGPPPGRLEQLLALSEAGVIEFLGAGVIVSADNVSGEFVAKSATIPGERRTRALVDAWLPEASTDHTDSRALRDLLDSGAGREQQVGSISNGLVEVRMSDSRLIRKGGGVHPRRFAVGPGTSRPNTGAFSRPGIDALAFREWDSVARAVLKELRSIREAAGTPEQPPRDDDRLETESSDDSLASAFDSAAYYSPEDGVEDLVGR